DDPTSALRRAAPLGEFGRAHRRRNRNGATRRDHPRASWGVVPRRVRRVPRAGAGRPPHATRGGGGAAGPSGRGGGVPRAVPTGARRQRLPLRESAPRGLLVYPRRAPALRTVVDRAAAGPGGHRGADAPARIGTARGGSEIGRASWRGGGG